MFMKVIPVSM